MIWVLLALVGRHTMGFSFSHTLMLGVYAGVLWALV